MTRNQDDRTLESLSSTVLSLVGMICMVLGALVVTFDYPQIVHLGGFDSSVVGVNNPNLDRGLYERLVIEFAIGVVILGAGVALCVPKMIIIIIKSFDRRRQI